MIRFLLFQICYIGFFLPCQGEIWPTLSLTELSSQSDQLVEARFLFKNQDDLLFLADDLLDEQQRWDTLVLKDYDYISRVKEGEKCLLYLYRPYEGAALEPVFSGFRIFQDNVIYYPFQRESPGGFYLFPHKSIFNWDSLKHRAVAIQRRISPIFQLRNMEPGVERNFYLLQFLSQHYDTLNDECGFDEDCGWGNTSVFEWISESEIPADIWRASQYFHAARFDKPIHEQLMYGGSNFGQSAEGKAFLLPVINDRRRPYIERLQALSYLESYCLGAMQNDTSSATGAYFQLCAKSVVPLLADEKLKEMALRVVNGLPDSCLSPFQAFLTEQYRATPPGTFRGNLGKVVASICDEATWKSLSQCDQNMAMTIPGFGTTSGAKRELMIYLFYGFGKEVINQKPTLHFQSIDQPERKFSLPINRMELPLKSSKENRWNHLYLDLPENLSGWWTVWLEGHAGNHDEYYWRTDEFSFQCLWCLD